MLREPSFRARASLLCCVLFVAAVVLACRDRLPLIIPRSAALLASSPSPLYAAYTSPSATSSDLSFTSTAQCLSWRAGNGVGQVTWTDGLSLRWNLEMPAWNAVALFERLVSLRARWLMFMGDSNQRELFFALRNMICDQIFTCVHLTRYSRLEKPPGVTEFSASIMRDTSRSRLTYQDSELYVQSGDRVARVSMRFTASMPWREKRALQEFNSLYCLEDDRPDARDGPCATPHLPYENSEWRGAAPDVLLANDGLWAWRQLLNATKIDVLFRLLQSQKMRVVWLSHYAMRWNVMERYNPNKYEYFTQAAPNDYLTRITDANTLRRDAAARYQIEYVNAGHVTDTVSEAIEQQISSSRMSKEASLALTRSQLTHDGLHQLEREYAVVVQLVFNVLSCKA